MGSCSASARIPVMTRRFTLYIVPRRHSQICSSVKPFYMKKTAKPRGNLAVLLMGRQPVGRGQPIDIIAKNM